MKIAVCCKIAPDPEDIVIRGDGLVDLSNASWKVGEYDYRALEAGKLLAESTGASFVAVTAGDSRIDKSSVLKDLLSRGPEELLMVLDDSLADADTALTAKTLTAALVRIGADVVLFGEGSADLYFRQTGVQVGKRLGWATLDAINMISAEGDSLRVERDLGSRIEDYEIESPCVLSVTTTIADPTHPSMRAILAAGKKPIERISLADLGIEGAGVVAVDVVSLAPPATSDRKHRIIEGDPAYAAAELVSCLKQESVI